MARSWYEQDALWVTLEPVLAGRKQRDHAAVVAPRLIELASLPMGGTMADLGSGSGRFAIPIARAGRHVTAIDHSAALISKLSKEAEASNLQVEVVRRDIRSFERAAAFDAVMLWGDTFGYYDRASDDAEVVAHAARSLKPGGRFLLQCTPRELATRRWPERTWHLLPGDRFLLEENSIIRNHGAVRHNWFTLNKNQSSKNAPAAFAGTRRLYSAEGIIRMLHKAGFGHVDCFGALDGRPFARHAETFIAVASV